MRKKSGMMGVFGLLIVVAFFVVALMFMPNMMMAIDVNASEHVNNTPYAQPYMGLVNTTQVLYTGFTIAPLLAIGLMLIVGLGWMASGGKR